jgi:plasmid maintenance system antidote protein VapI
MTLHRIVMCSVRELGLTMTEVAAYLKISAPTVSVAVRRGMKIAREENLKLKKLLNINM